MWIIKSEVSDTFRFKTKEEADVIMAILLKRKIKATIRYVEG